MTIFDYLKDIAVTKRGDLPLDQYVPFLVTRWLSFINPTFCAYTNEFNKKSLLEDKEMHYKTLIACFPKVKYLPKIRYVKKVKETVVDEDKRIDLIAQRYEISKREAEQLLDFTCQI